MAGISFSDNPGHPAFLELAKHRIGDRVRVRVVHVHHLDNMPDDARADLLAAVGRKLKIKDLHLWETGNPQKPFKLTYEFHIAHLRGAPNRNSFLISIFLDDEEIEPVKRAARQRRIRHS